MSANLDAARTYGEKFLWSVFPLSYPVHGACSCKSACVSPAKHPIGSLVPNGHLDASNFRSAIDRWWSADPNANVGISCRRSGLLVLDIDPRNGGDESLRDLEADHGALPETVTVATGGGGRHFYFTAGRGEVKDGAIARGVEFKYNGYVVAPPSIHISGGAYAWAPGKSPWEAPTVAPPEWLLGLGKMKAGRTAAPAGGGEHDAGKIPAGGRHHEMMRQAGAMWSRKCSWAEIEAALRAMNEARFDPPLDAARLEGDLRGIHQSLKGYERAAERPLSDLGNAERLIDMHGHDLRFVPELGWHVWDGTRFRPDSDGEVHRRAGLVARAMYGQAEREEDKHLRRALSEHARRSENNGRLNALVERAAVQAEIVVHFDGLDAAGHLLNAKNGVVDLRDGTLRPHDREFLMTKIAGADYVPGARSGLWESFLESQIPNVETRRFTQMATGAAFLWTGEERLFFFDGPGGSGKGTYLSSTLAAIGDYGKTSDADVFTGDNPHEAFLELAELVGKRIVVLPEIKRGAKLAMRILKQISGGDGVRARMHRMPPFAYKPTFTFFFSTNDIPTIGDSGDSAAWRRITVIRFPIAIPKEKQDPGVKTALCNDPENRRAVLAWLVEGAVAYVVAGSKLIDPESVKKASAEWQAANDPLQAFFAAECVFAPEDWAATPDLRDTYKRYVKETEDPELDWNSAIVPALRARRCVGKRGSKGVNGWKGVRLATAAEQADAFAEEVRHA